MSPAAESNSALPLRFSPQPPAGIAWPEGSHITFGWKKVLMLKVLGWLCLPLKIVGWLSTKREGIVILEPYGMGDAITLEPLISSLLKAGHSVTACLKPAWHPLYQGVKGLTLEDSAAPWTSYSTKSKYDPRRYLGSEFWRWLSKLRRTVAGRIAIDPRGDVRSLVALHLGGARQVITLSHLLATRHATPWPCGEKAPLATAMQRWQANLSCLSALGINPADDRANGPRFESARVQSVGKKMIGFVILAPYEGKLWLWDRWIEVAQRLQREGWAIRAICGPGETKALQHGLKTDENPFVQVIELKQVTEWERELGELDLLLTIDTGPMHLACALQVPVVALFGSTTLPLWAPPGEKSVVVTRQWQFTDLPVLQIESGLSLSQAAMEAITVDDVMDGIRQAAPE